MTDRKLEPLEAVFEMRATKTDTGDLGGRRLMAKPLLAVVRCTVIGGLVGLLFVGSVILFGHDDGYKPRDACAAAFIDDAESLTECYQQEEAGVDPDEAVEIVRALGR